MRNVIAHYSTWKALASIMVGLAVGVGVIYFTICFDGGHVLRFAEAPQRRPFLPILFVGWICAVITLSASITLLKRLLSGDSDALWIEDGQLIFFHRWVFNVRCADIEEVSGDDSDGVRRRGIVLRNRNGSEKVIPTIALKETKDIVLSRLKAKL